MSKPLLVLFCVVLGHFGWWLFCFNRINAVGLTRRIVKLSEKCFIFACLTIPAWIAVCEGQELFTWCVTSSRWWPESTPMFHFWGAWCAACFVVLGPMWLETRRALVPPDNLISERSEIYDVHQDLKGTVIGTRATKLLNLLPGNQIAKLAISEKVIQLGRQIVNFDQLRIGHFSDLHFTGQLTKDYYRFAIQKIAALSPDLVALTGDIVDFDHCLDWIEDLLIDLNAPLGCYFLLGNHEQRLSDWREVPRRLCGLGWHDLGAGPATKVQELRGNQLRIELIGNERPWFDRSTGKRLPGNNGGETLGSFRLGLSHSPDQIEWARDQNLDLLLAGHTHGGQIRLPCIGPLVTPSWYGSRFASGVFYVAPTVIHVSRGLAGVQPLRWNCLPEVSLLTIRSATIPSLR